VSLAASRTREDVVADAEELGSTASGAVEHINKPQ
jgi:hypothetical protein